jgi:hypothetical protein
MGRDGGIVSRDERWSRIVVNIEALIVVALFVLCRECRSFIWVETT